MANRVKSATSSRPGKRTKRTDDPKKPSSAERVFLNAISEGFGVKDACAQAGIGKSTVYEWLASNPEFKVAYDQACIQGEEEALDIARKWAKDGLVTKVKTVKVPISDAVEGDEDGEVVSTGEMEVKAIVEEKTVNPTLLMKIIHMRQEARLAAAAKAAETSGGTLLEMFEQAAKDGGGK